jgi:hypothetical protein
LAVFRSSNIIANYNFPLNAALAIRGEVVFKSSRSEKSTERLIEEKIYAQVVNELSQGQKRDGLWGKALADSDGVEDKAKSLYIKYRVQSIIDEMVVAQEEQTKNNEAEAVKLREIERERQNQLEAQRRQEWGIKFKNFLLFLGVFFIPFIFAWFTLQSGYKTSSRILSFSWLAFNVWAIFAAG